MSAALDLIILWHMHQPDYRDHVTGEVLEPWTYLHAIKDYTDMAAHLERHPEVRVVVNFTPVLLDQLDALASDLHAGRPADRLARLLIEPNLEQASEADRLWLLECAFRSNHATMVTPFADYVALRRIAESFDGVPTLAARYLGAQYFADLVTWYHLAWTGETVRRGSVLMQRLLAKGHRFSMDERRALADELAAVIGELPGRYRRLSARGQIELSTTPYSHPLAPLLVDFTTARATVHDAPLPKASAYPGGAARVSWHIDAALARHQITFGTPARGMWPAEGGLSDAVLTQLANKGVGWTMSGEAMLMNSLRAATSHPSREDALARVYRFAAAPDIAVLFRDDELSDLVGFEYARWHGKEAAMDLVARLERRREDVASRTAHPLVVIALDGENAWEHYPYNAYYFFEELYALLARHPSIRTTTPSEYLARGQTTVTLPHLVAGSWVYGTLSTWIGDPAKNAAWDRLCAAKIAFDERATNAAWSADERRRIEHQLALAESSDWFWWLGEGAVGHGPRTFDRLARHNLENLYRLMGLPPPADLALPIEPTPPTGANVIGAMRRSHPAA
jgi:alpha-amylase/alpha-mannosidase (GH57 family)